MFPYRLDILAPCLLSAAGWTLALKASSFGLQATALTGAHVLAAAMAALAYLWANQVLQRWAKHHFPLDSLVLTVRGHIHGGATALGVGIALYILADTLAFWAVELADTGLANVLEDPMRLLVNIAMLAWVSSYAHGQMRDASALALKPVMLVPLLRPVSEQSEA